MARKKPAAASPDPSQPESDVDRQRKIPEWFSVSDLEQLNVLANPTRQRILSQFVEEARTTKQVAELLGEPPTRLYHHVDALAKNGLLILEREVPKRGTTEKYYRAVARQFRVDESCLMKPGFVDENSRVVSEMLDQARGTILQALADAVDGDPLHTTASSALINTTEKNIEKISGALLKRIGQLSEKKPAPSKDPTYNYRIMILVFPDTESESDE